MFLRIPGIVRGFSGLSLTLFGESLGSHRPYSRAYFSFTFPAGCATDINAESYPHCLEQ